MYESYADILESYIIAEKKRLKAEAQRIWDETSLEDYNIAKKICENIIKKEKNNNKWKALPLDLKIIDFQEDRAFDINIFEDEWCMNEYSEKFIPEAEPCFNKIYDDIKIAIGKESRFKNTVNVEIFENNIITIVIR